MFKIINYGLIATSDRIRGITILGKKSMKINKNVLNGFGDFAKFCRPPPPIGEYSPNFGLKPLIWRRIRQIPFFGFLWLFYSLISSFDKFRYLIPVINYFFDLPLFFIANN